MSRLVELPFLPAVAEMPESHRALEVAALNRAEALRDPADPDRCPGFVLTPPHVAWAMVNAARAMAPRPGAVFCEWGAGIGLVATLAARAGFEAWGVELEPTLVRAARDLAETLGEPMRVVEGSYKPAGFFDGTPVAERGQLWIGGRDLTAADVCFVYAWPAEVAAARSFFANHAPTGAILILYEGGKTVRAYRQVPESDASSAASPLR
jgi:hypothetical protein